MRSFEIPHPITITVDLALGDLRVTASNRADTAVTVQPTNPSKAAEVTAPNDTRVEYPDGRLAINTPKSWRRLSPVENGGSVPARSRSTSRPGRASRPPRRSATCRSTVSWTGAGSRIVPKLDYDPPLIFDGVRQPKIADPPTGAD